MNSVNGISLSGVTKHNTTVSLNAFQCNALKFMPSSLTWSIVDRDWLFPNMAHHRVMRAATANQNVLYYFVSGGGLTVKIDNF
jgi:hypothetical protein